LELQPLVRAVVGVGELLAEQVEDVVAAGVELPGLTLGDPEQPGAPWTVAIGLESEELNPRESAGVLDVLAARVDGVADSAEELVVELQEQVRLVAAEP
jgi:hypothetical protein